MARWLKNDFKPGSKVPHDWLNTVANFWNGLTVGQSYSPGLERQSDGRFTKILVGSPSGSNDTEGYDAAKDPDGRMTIEQNPEDDSGFTDSHSNERQLRNVHLTKDGSSSIPFFLSETPYQGAGNRVVGELYWATPDGNRKMDGVEAVYKSLEIADTHTTTSKGKYSMSLYGFPTCYPCHVPYAKLNGISGRELEWRYPVAIAGSPIDAETGTTFGVLTNVDDAGTPPIGESYVALSYDYRNATVHKGAVDFSAELSTTKYLTVDINFEQIITNIESLVKHNSLDGTGDIPPWSADNVGHDARYLRIGAGWTGAANNNTCTGIAHLTTGERAIDFENGSLFGDTPAEGATVDYGARKLYAFEGSQLEGSQLETVDWQTRTLTAASAAAPWTATLAFRIATSDPAKYVDFVVGDGTLEIKDQDGERIGYFSKA